MNLRIPMPAPSAGVISPSPPSIRIWRVTSFWMIYAPGWKKKKIVSF